MPPGSDSKLESLRKILEQEETSSFPDTTVIGGLDRFLTRWADELKPAVEGLNSYSVLTPPQRAEWAGRAREKMASTGPAADTRTPATRSRQVRRAAKPRPTALALDDDVTRLKGISTQHLARLKKIGVGTVNDLVHLFPSRHNDFAHMRKVSELEPGQEQTVVATVWEATLSRSGPRRKSTQAVLGDETGNVRAIWFNNPYMARTLRPGAQIVLSGRVNVFRGQPVFESPEYEILQGQEELIHTGRLVPVYPSTEGMPQRTLRRFVKAALDVCITQVSEFLPEELMKRTGLMGVQDAIAQAHYPDSQHNWTVARRRLAFDELLLLQLAVLSRKLRWQKESNGIPLASRSAGVDAFVDALPFSLTRTQRAALDDILSDIEDEQPMSRLLQGDVGSGKTVVALAALLAAAFSGYKGVLMAPTEILAEQHFTTVSRLLGGEPGALDDSHVVIAEADWLPRPLTVALAIGGVSQRRKNELQRRLAEGQIDIVVGTHALIQPSVEIPDLALVVVDEQHRFGVMQRASLREKGTRPHLLVMSATPIPRSLALTLYGDLDVSNINELPPGRQRIKTRWVDPERREAAYGFLRKEVEEGRQGFIVCPLIEESEAVQSRAATEEHARLSTEVFPDLDLGLLHGRMPFKEKQEVMNGFLGGDLNILVSTPVIEVGIDVPNATVMLIDGADRFGLAQLHQFRGRVGRGEHQSYCLLLADSPGNEARERLRIVERVHDGFELAEEDLRLRGSGDYLGTRQSGLPEFRVARISDQDILDLARREAIKLLDADPDLASPENERLSQRFKAYAAGLTEDPS